MLSYFVAPLRGRGLKLTPPMVSALNSRRSLTGAWIETFRTKNMKAGSFVAPLRGRGLKREEEPSLAVVKESLPYGGVD